MREKKKKDKESAVEEQVYIIEGSTVKVTLTLTRMPKDKATIPRQLTKSRQDESEGNHGIRSHSTGFVSKTEEVMRKVWSAQTERKRTNSQVAFTYNKWGGICSCQEGRRAGIILPRVLECYGSRTGKVVLEGALICG